MTSHDHTDGDVTRTRMPADVDAPDKVLYGLTFRQLAILAVAAVVFYTGWHALHRLVAAPVLLVVGIILCGLVFGLAVGRRDGLPLDVWLVAAVRHARAPHALSTADTTAHTPAWVQVPESTMVLPAPLQLPATAVDERGDITLGDTSAAIVAATTVNLALRTGEEQAALVDTFGRWLNSLATRTQIVVSAQPVDLHSRARQLAQAADRMPHPALADAAADHATFLHDLAERRDPLHRHVLIVATTPDGSGEHAALRRAEATARALSGLGVTTRTLDGPAATAALAAAADPYRPPRPGGLAAPTTVITGPPVGRPQPGRTSS